MITWEPTVYFGFTQDVLPHGDAAAMAKVAIQQSGMAGAHVTLPNRRGEYLVMFRGDSAANVFARLCKQRFGHRPHRTTDYRRMCRLPGRGEGRAPYRTSQPPAGVRL